MCKRRPNVPLTKDFQQNKRYSFDSSQSAISKQQFWKRKSIEDRLMRKLQCKTETHDNSQENKDKLFHKKIREYRNLIEEHPETHSLEFILSLRQNQQKLPRLSLKKQVAVEPFQVSKKLTSNQKIKKNISDINSDIERIYDASYRWKRYNGTDVRVSCDFECSLRKEDFAGELKHNQSFKSVLRPLKLKRSEQRRFKRSQILCEHQNKIFNIEE